MRDGQILARAPALQSISLSLAGYQYQYRARPAQHLRAETDAIRRRFGRLVHGMYQLCDVMYVIGKQAGRMAVFPHAQQDHIERQAWRNGLGVTLCTRLGAPFGGYGIVLGWR